MCSASFCSHRVKPKPIKAHTRHKTKDTYSAQEVRAPAPLSRLFAPLRRLSQSLSRLRSLRSTRTHKGTLTPLSAQNPLSCPCALTDPSPYRTHPKENRKPLLASLTLLVKHTHQDPSRPLCDQSSPSPISSSSHGPISTSPPLTHYRYRVVACCSAYRKYQHYRACQILIFLSSAPE